MESWRNYPFLPSVYESTVRPRPADEPPGYALRERAGRSDRAYTVLVHDGAPKAQSGQEVADRVPFAWRSVAEVAA